MLHAPRRLRRLPAALAVTAMLLLTIGLTTGPTIAGAATVAQQSAEDPVPVDAEPGPVLGDETNLDTTADVTFSVPWAVFLVGSVIPLIVAAVARSSWSSLVKRRLNFGLSVGTAILTVLIDNGGSVPLLQLLSAVFTTLAVSEVTYLTLWKDGALQKALLRVGNGGAP